MSYSSYIALIPLLPLAVFVVMGIFGRKYFSKNGGVLACMVLAISTALAFYTAWQYFFIDGKVEGIYRAVIPLRYTWLDFSSGLSIDMGILLDPVSVMMLVVVTFVSLMVNLFSLGYMKGEERFSTYYSFLALFTFSMLGLVLSSNVFQIYIFWELVGVSSYLLIGFYYDRPAAVAASKKAFIVTRFADLGFLVGILILSFHAGSLDFQTIIGRLTDPHSSQFLSITTASFLGISLLSWGLALVFMGGAGKSAMFPLHIWLPDAMEGPTPVSALIHAATMVVAGVFLVARLFPVFSLEAGILQLVTWVGAFSAIFAAVIACTQTDIKRILAFSTMSQIGFMLFALGVAGDGYTASLFHLFTHAFFKSLLFLCAGVIIHIVHSNDLKDMGGLRKSMPLTHACFLIACLAIAGIPPFSGFFSKEEILGAAWHSNKSVYFVGLITSGITAFYMFRLYFSVFWNKGSVGHGSNNGITEIKNAHNEGAPGEGTPGEGTLSMKIPLVLLSAGALLAGLIPFSRFVTADGRAYENPVSLTFSIAPVILGLAGILLAAMLYRQHNDRPQRIAGSMGKFYQAVYKKFYIDELYLFITKKIIFNCIARPAAWIDKHIIDGTVNGIAVSVGKIAGWIRGIQSGKLQQYVLYFFGGILGLALFFIYRHL